MDTTYFVDKFVSTTPGEPYRLLPFGKIIKDGVTRDITPELASQFKFPPFKPPIKLGSHDEETPAGGHLLKLEVREDGLWVYPEMTEKGARSVGDGDYRYHSPEIIWEEGALITNEGTIPGPLVVGDALLHMPYLGESTAFYTVETKEIEMETVNIPVTLWDKLSALLNPPEPKPAPEVKITETAEFQAVAQERDEFKSKVDKIEADKQHAELLKGIVTSLQNKDQFGSMYIEMSKAEEAAGVMGSMTPEQRDWCMKNFGALAMQVNESALLGEKGAEGQTSTEDPKAAFNAAVLAISAEKQINYNAAFEQAKASHADLFAAAFNSRK